MSWLIPRKREEKRSADNVICGVSVVFKQEGEDVIVSGKARTENDLDRLKRIMDEMVEELLGEHEAERPSPTHPRRKR